MQAIQADEVGPVPDPGVTRHQTDIENDLQTIIAKDLPKITVADGVLMTIEKAMIIIESETHLRHHAREKKSNVRKTRMTNCRKLLRHPLLQRNPQPKA